jgi:CHAT domain-containing protein
MQSGGKCLIDAQTVHVKYWDAPSVTSDGSKAGSSHNSVPSQANYAHPYYWAPFILMGNWN